VVYHILKDGSVVHDISGRIVKVEDAKTLYDLMDSINGSRSRKRKDKTTKTD
jgi:hypothetical protein